jgi:hypothetical protein
VLSCVDDTLPLVHVSFYARVFGLRLNKIIITRLLQNKEKTAQLSTVSSTKFETRRNQWRANYEKEQD